MLNESQSRLHLHNAAGPRGSLTFLIAGEKVTLEGDLHGEPARMHLVRLRENLILLRRGFHWINEAPFNR